jgi:uncharacterized protein (DUF1697 family)
MRYVAFLRGINVGGHRVKMDHLRGLFEALGFRGVSTFIASGNVVFETELADPTAVELRIESHLKFALGYEVATFLRTPEELALIAARRPFDGDDVGRTVHVGFVRETLGDPREKALRALSTERDDFAVVGREVYWRCLGKSTDSLVSWPLVAKTIQAPSTLRNLTTVRALAAKHGVGG